MDYPVKWEDLFLVKFAETLDESEAAKQANIPFEYLQEFKEQNPGFAGRVKIARQQAANKLLGAAFDEAVTERNPSLLKYLLDRLPSELDHPERDQNINHTHVVSLDDWETGKRERRAEVDGTMGLVEDLDQYQQEAIVVEWHDLKTEKDTEQGIDE